METAIWEERGRDKMRAKAIRLNLFVCWRFFRCVRLSASIVCFVHCQIMFQRQVQIPHLDKTRTILTMFYIKQNNAHHIILISILSSLSWAHGTHRNVRILCRLCLQVAPCKITTGQSWKASEKLKQIMLHGGRAEKAKSQGGAGRKGRNKWKSSIKSFRTMS